MHRSNFVDPFSTFHFLRTYNRLVSPTDLSQYYNFALIKDSQDQQQQQQRTLVFPPSKSDIFQIPPQIYISNESTNIASQQRTFSNQSPNRTVSSTCPSTPPPPPPPALSSISAPQEPVPATTSLAINSFLNDNCFEQMYNNKDGNSNSNSLDSYQCILNRRQRGEKRPIPDEQKDDKYFERRKRNNEAAKKSRDARKLREDRIAFRAAILEQENAILRAQTLALREEITTLRHMLCNNRSSGQIPVN